MRHRRLRVEYEVLPAVLSLDQALAPGAPLVHDDAPGNVAHHFAFERGDDNASVVCALPAQKSGRPVKLIHTREEEFLASHPRMPMRTGCGSASRATDGYG